MLKSCVPLALTFSPIEEEAAAVCVAPPGAFFPPALVAALVDVLAWPPADSAQDDLRLDDCSEAVASRDFQAAPQVGGHSAPAAAAHDSAPQVALLDDCSEALASRDSPVAPLGDGHSAPGVVVDDSAPQDALLDDRSEALASHDSQVAPQAGDHFAPAAAVDDSVPQDALLDDCSEGLASHDSQAAPWTDGLSGLAAEVDAVRGAPPPADCSELVVSRDSRAASWTDHRSVPAVAVADSAQEPPLPDGCPGSAEPQLPGEPAYSAQVHDLAADWPPGLESRAWPGAPALPPELLPHATSASRRGPPPGRDATPEPAAEPRKKPAREAESLWLSQFDWPLRPAEPPLDSPCWHVLPEPLRAPEEPELAR